MNTATRFWTLGAVLAVCGVAVAAGAEEPQRADGAIAAVEAFHAALKRGDALAALAQLDEHAIIFESGYQETRSEYASHHLAADIAFARDTQRKLNSTAQHCGDTLCVIMQRSETTGKYKGKTVRSEGVETTVLRRDDETWKIQHVHWSSHK